MLINADAFDPDSGSIGGFTIATTTAGVALRARSQHVNPHTPRQETQRRLYSNLTVRWSDVLSIAQQDAWGTYAMTTVWTHPIKGPLFLDAITMYVVANLPRLRAGLTLIDTAPPSSGLATYTTPTFTYDSNLDLVIAFNNADTWATATGGALLISMLQPTLPRIGGTRRKAQFVAAILGNTAAPPTSPQTLTNPWPSVVGQHHLIAHRVTNADGRPVEDTKDPSDVILPPSCTDAFCNTFPDVLLLDVIGLNPIQCNQFNVTDYPLTRTATKACKWENTGPLNGFLQCSDPLFPLRDGWILTWAAGNSERPLSGTPIGLYVHFIGGAPCYPGTETITIHT